MPKIKDPEAADLTNFLVEMLEDGRTEINGRLYATLACHEMDDYQTVFLELADIDPDNQGPNETIGYSIRITKNRKK